jgi:hypothetical protein
VGRLRTENPALRKKAVERETWIMGGFYTGLWGKDMLLIKYTGMAKIIINLVRLLMNLISVISGRTKGNQLLGAQFGVPCFATMEESHIWPGRWVSRLLE